MVKEKDKVIGLSVAEALPKDAGRGIVRLDPPEMAQIGVQVGDVVQVLGKRATAAKVMPTYPDDRGRGVVQMDGILRENAQCGLGEKARIEPVACQEATGVVLVPLTPSRISSSRDSGYLTRALEGIPFVRGDRVRATLFGTRYQEFTVESASPDGAVFIGPTTMVKIKKEEAVASKKGGSTYEDIGALRKEIHKIREMVELPLKYPELFERLGIDAPRGVLLYGPPGCGKTLIARAVANETDASFFHASGPEVIHKFYGESEAHLRAIFENASKSAPSIVFIDEIDAIASKREDVRGDQQVERRVVAQLLALLDGLKGRGQVIVIAATNVPHLIDPALRRPGRLDREIAISVPDKNGRLEILQIHTRGMPLAPDVRLEHLAELTHGFVGADLEALCREAAMTTLRRLVPGIQMDMELLPPELLSRLEVTADDFLEALKEVEPSAIREVFTEVPDVKWEDVGGLEEVKQMLMETIEWPFKYPELFEKAGTSPPKGILLSGPPGTGKTLLAKAVASQSGLNFIAVKGPALLSRWVGESERGVREVFRKARQTSPCIVFFDEIDALAPIRGGGSDSHVTERVISQFLTELDGVEELRGVTILAATNRLDIVDPALIRSGRFDLHIELPFPDKAARQEIFAIHTREKPLASDVCIDTLATQAEGLSGSDIEAVCRKATMLALREHVMKRAEGFPGGDADDFQVAAKYFQQAFNERR